MIRVSKLKIRGRDVKCKERKEDWLLLTSLENWIS